MLIAASVGASGWVAVKCLPWIDGNSSALQMLATLFSILAGFSVAAFPFVGDPNRLPPSWRAGVNYRQNLTREVLTLGWGLVLYLTTVVSAFAVELLPKDHPYLVAPQLAVLFFASLSVIYAVSLAPRLYRIHTERIDRFIDDQRAEPVKPPFPSVDELASQRAKRAAST